MQPTLLLQLIILAAAGHVSAAPVVDSGLQTPKATTAELVKRVDVKPFSCGPITDQRAWPLQSVQGSLDNLIKFDGSPTKPGGYPHQYGKANASPSDPDVINALNGIPGCATGQTGFKFYEFPLTDPFYDGTQDQGPDRVIAISPNITPGGTRVFTFCLAITHRGGTGPLDPSFRPCV